MGDFSPHKNKGIYHFTDIGNMVNDLRKFRLVKTGLGRNVAIALGKD